MKSDKIKKINKLKKLMFTSVDMVGAGANPEAYINLYKNKEGKLMGNEKLSFEEEQEKVSQGLFKSMNEINKNVNLSEKEKMAKIESSLKDFNKACFDLYGLKVENKEKKREPKEYINKDLENKFHPEIKKALLRIEELQKSIEMKEMREVAKKYVILGEKEDELAKKLYEMKEKPDVLKSYLALLDKNLKMIEKSGMFSEIGKSGKGFGESNALAKIDNIALEIQKSNPQLSKSKILMQAWKQHPELISEYENEYQGGK